MIRNAWLATIAILACSHPKDDPAAQPPMADARAAAWRDDLHTLAATISTHHKNPFFHVGEPTWRAAVADLDARIPQLDDAHVVAGFARIVASIGDAHTLIGAVGHTGFYPLAFVWFEDGIFVVGATADATWAIGRKLVGIGRHSIDEVVAAVSPLIARDNAVGVRAGVPDVLLDPALLAGVDLAAADHAAFELAAADGSIRELDVKPGASGAAIAPPPSPPLHLQGPNTKYWNKYVDADQMIYFAYNACADDPRVGTFARFAADTLAFADGHPVRRFVIDLRNNGGGNSEIVKPLIDGLAARPALAGRVFAIIGMHTFSSAVLGAIELKRRLHATLVGGPTLGKPNAYGEIQLFTLPHSRLRVQYSTKLFAFPDFPGDSVDPDLAVTVTSSDWFAGRDPAIAAILDAPAP